MADRDTILASVTQYLSSLAITPIEIFMYYCLPVTIHHHINNTLRALCEDRVTSAATYCSIYSDAALNYLRSGRREYSTA